MCNPRASLLLVSVLHLVVALVSAQGSGPKTPWLTLSGDPPLVVARGGFSGIFPDSSGLAYNVAVAVSVPDVVLWCDVQLTKDGIGICLADMKLENGTNIQNIYNNRRKKYIVDGVLTEGWFSIDFTRAELQNVAVSQPIYSRSSKFDGNGYLPLSPEDVVSGTNPPGMWLNIQHSAFFTQHNLSMRNYVIGVTRSITVNYISSPELGFLSSIKSRIPKTTKLVFRFMEKDQVEIMTNQTYDSLSKNLTFIKTFASAILVPKHYIWPIDAKSKYLLPHTSLVSDAHKEGLEIFAADFVNDLPLSYNYSYDPVAEYLNFVDNGEFSVDGVISDFPVTASASIDCFAHVSSNATKKVKTLVISKFGSSGDYPSCTDLAYMKAINDGADVLDCPVQISSDGVPFCFSNINLIESSDAAQSRFSPRMLSVPEVKRDGPGIFAFNLTWDEIQKGLTPLLTSPQSRYTLFRNPNNLNAGKFISLSEFLDLSKNSQSLSGILLSLEDAAYLAEKQGLSVTDSVITALSKAGLDNQTALKVMIQSTDISVLEKFKGKANYKLVYKIDQEIRGIDNLTLEEIDKYADSVVVDKASVYPDTQLYLTGEKNVVTQLHSKNISVYVELFSNEFVSQAWDFFSDATVEINTYVFDAGIDGVITDFPKTSDRYRRNKCLGLGDKTPGFMTPVKPGSLLEIMETSYLPPAEAPNPILTEADVAEPPLPPTLVRTPPSGTDSAAGPTPRNLQPKVSASYLVSSIAMILATIALY